MTKKSQQSRFAPAKCWLFCRGLVSQSDEPRCTLNFARVPRGEAFSYLHLRWLHPKPQNLEVSNLILFHSNGRNICTLILYDFVIFVQHTGFNCPVPGPRLWCIPVRTIGFPSNCIYATWGVSRFIISLHDIKDFECGLWQSFFWVSFLPPIWCMNELHPEKARTLIVTRSRMFRLNACRVGITRSGLFSGWWRVVRF